MRKGMFVAVFVAIGLPTIVVTICRADDWLGRDVFCKEKALARVGESDISVEKIPFPARVADVNGDWLWLGRAWVRKSDVMSTDEALSYFTEYTQKHPKDAWGWQHRGIVWNTKREYENAIKDYTEAIHLDPKNDAAYRHRAVAWKASGNLDQAIKDYSEAIRLDPQHAGAFRNRGMAWEAKEDLQKALSDFNQAIHLDPEYAVAYNNRGITHGALGEYDKAINDFGEALRLEPKYGTAHNSLAWLRATCPVDQFRNGDEAVEQATRGCELCAWKDFDRLDTLAAAYAEKRDFDQAKKYEQQAIDLASSDKAKQSCRERLALYKQSQPYREQPAK